MGNIITRRDFLVRKMAAEFPSKPIGEISNAVWELEMLHPKTDWDEKVFYDSGKPVKRQTNKKQGPRNSGRSKADK